jgi:hypothetical protein
MSMTVAYESERKATVAGSSNIMLWCVRAPRPAASQMAVDTRRLVILSLTS